MRKNAEKIDVNFHRTGTLNSFPLNRVPCNDGLAVEFYKMFLASIGKRLAECYVVSFEKGELSSS